ncbi:MAG TPA: hypothetical protein VEU47_18495 [Candidatus Cybelea sp.]|nr:hypothetical protein [Candidatus Cybelea sp.]
MLSLSKHEAASFDRLGMRSRPWHPPLSCLQLEWPTTSVQVERLLKKIAGELGIGEDELKQRALLKAC